MQNFREWAVRAAEWGVDYRARLRDMPVRPPVAPGDIAAQIADGCDVLTANRDIGSLRRGPAAVYDQSSANQNVMWHGTDYRISAAG